MSKKTLILGLGNTILGDDRIGLDVAHLVHKQLNNPDYDCIESQLVGANIIDFIVGYKTLIVIDSIKTYEGKAGDVYYLALDDLPKTTRLNSPHAVGFYWTIQMGKTIGLEVPEEIRIYAIEVEDPYTFREGLSEELEKLLPKVVEEIVEREKPYARVSHC